MRAIPLLVLSAAVLCGCSMLRTSSDNPKKPKSAVKPAEKIASRPATPRETSQPAHATPINEPSGKVASVNAGLRFVVIDFALNPVPQVDQKLAVYRQGQKVGMIKISGQARNSIVAADITEGEAAVGDEVRPE